MIDVATSKYYYYHFDGLGSVIALSDENGDIVERYEYDVYGQTQIMSASYKPRATSDYDNPYMFTGRRIDAETGLYYYRVRTYNPQIGRFMQPDPVAQFMHLFSLKTSLQGKMPGIPGTYVSYRSIRKFLENDPVGRFLKAAPAGRLIERGKLGFLVIGSLYSYCGNNPVNFVDPCGLFSLKGLIGSALIGLGIGIGVAATGQIKVSGTILRRRIS